MAVIRIKIQADGKEFYIEAEPGRNLLELLREAGIYVDEIGRAHV